MKDNTVAELLNGSVGELCDAQILCLTALADHASGELGLNCLLLVLDCDFQPILRDSASLERLSRASRIDLEGELPGTVNSPVVVFHDNGKGAVSGDLDRLYRLQAGGDIDASSTRVLGIGPSDVRALHGLLDSQSRMCGGMCIGRCGQADDDSGGSDDSRNEHYCLCVEDEFEGRRTKLTRIGKV